ncbi:MAG: PHP domain-containing protein [Clostridia bacterium]|nr:PHP domain-containing protein [Clostridia bacterium]
MAQVDLHVHTTASDGLLDPCQVISWAIKKGIKAISITDHDTVDGYRQGLKCDNIKDIELIPGVEINTYINDIEIHILGYYMDIDDTRFLSWLDKLFNARLERAKRMLKKFNHLGFDFSLDDVKEISKDGAIGRPHFARLLVKKGLASSTEEAFNKYLLPGGPAYVQRYKLHPKDAIKIIRQSKGIPVLAHPGLIHKKHIIKYIIDAGIAGMEVYHSKHSKQETDHLFNVAEKNNLLITGGTDFHGEMYDGMPTIGDVGIDYNTFLKLKKYRTSH